MFPSKSNHISLWFSISISVSIFLCSKKSVNQRRKKRNDNQIEIGVASIIYGRPTLRISQFFCIYIILRSLLWFLIYRFLSLLLLVPILSVFFPLSFPCFPTTLPFLSLLILILILILPDETRAQGRGGRRCRHEEVQEWWDLGFRARNADRRWCLRRRFGIGWWYDLHSLHLYAYRSFLESSNRISSRSCAGCCWLL